MSSKWDTSEHELLLQHYAQSPKTQILLMLPGRSWKSIGERASKLKIKRKYSDLKWTNEELDFIKELYHLNKTTKLKKSLPNRTWAAIRLKAHLLGLKNPILKNQIQRSFNQKIKLLVEPMEKTK